MIVSFGMADDYRKPSERKIAHLRRIRATQAPQLGSRNGMAKLTEEQVAKIRELRAAGVGPTILAERFGVGRTMIWKIVAGKFWKHV